MARNTTWTDDYWPLLLQVYLRKPQGVKPTYHRAMVDLSLELHVPPTVLRAQTERLAALDTPRLERIWQTYGRNPQRLARAVHLWRAMRGFGDADAFYEGVELHETFERDFRPLPAAPRLMPFMLVPALRLYFQLTPLTMVAQTPEVAELAKLMGIDADLLVDVLHAFQRCDPFLALPLAADDPLAASCGEVWRRFGGEPSAQLDRQAADYESYFK